MAERQAEAGAVMAHRRPAPHKDDRPRLQLRLYVAAGAPHSVQALASLRALCDSRLPGCYDLEVVDVLENPARALVDAVFVTPTLIKLGRPEVRVVGNLSDHEEVWRALGLDAYQGLVPGSE